MLRMYSDLTVLQQQCVLEIKLAKDEKHHGAKTSKAVLCAPTYFYFRNSQKSCNFFIKQANFEDKHDACTV